jgi:hypothetical protein
MNIHVSTSPFSLSCCPVHYQLYLSNIYLSFFLFIMSIYVLFFPCIMYMYIYSCVHLSFLVYLAAQSTINCTYLISTYLPIYSLCPSMYSPFLVSVRRCIFLFMPYLSVHLLVLSVELPF